MPHGGASPSVNVERIRTALGISGERVASLPDLAPKTVTHLEEQDQLPPSSTAVMRLMKIQEIVDLGLVVFTPDGFRRFMPTPLPAFRGLTALQLIERDEPEQVFGSLVSLHEGFPS